MAKNILIVISIIMLIIFGLYVYLGTYLVPIAPHWITQLPPNPPSPKIKSGEFSFSMECEINNNIVAIEDILVCEFGGFVVNSFGGEKKRIWKSHLKNEQSYELFAFRSEESKYNEQKNKQIVLYTIDNYKVMLSLVSAEYLMNEPGIKETYEIPNIRVYDQITGYYKDPSQTESFLKENNFKLINWKCDSPLKNSFKRIYGLYNNPIVLIVLFFVIFWSLFLHKILKTKSFYALILGCFLAFYLALIIATITGATAISCISLVLFCATKSLFAVGFLYYLIRFLRETWLIKIH